MNVDTDGLLQETGGIDLIFHTNTESGKTDDLQSDPNVNVAFLNSTGEWASISGQATVVTDPETVRKTYSQSLKAWLGDLGDGKHDGGPDDPRIGVIHVKTRTATYAIAIGTVLGRGAEIVKGALTGQAPNVNKLRELNEDELNQCMLCHFLFVLSLFISVSTVGTSLVFNLSTIWRTFTFFFFLI